MKSADLLGTWSLETFSAKGADGTEIFPFGDAPKGLITYTTAGYMAAVLMRSGRPKFASGDPLGGRPEEIKEAFEGFDAYAGRYEFDEETSIATHHAEVARFPNWENSAQVRYAKLVGAKLYLSTPEIFAMGQKWVATLTWRKT
jgi:hypothetical protein